VFLILASFLSLPRHLQISKILSGADEWQIFPMLTAKEEYLDGILTFSCAVEDRLPVPKLLAVVSGLTLQFSDLTVLVACIRVMSFVRSTNPYY